MGGVLLLLKPIASHDYSCVSILFVSSFIMLFARGDHCFDGRSERSFQMV